MVQITPRSWIWSPYTSFRVGLDHPCGSLSTQNVLWFWFLPVLNLITKWCCAKRVSGACWQSSVSHTNCSLNWKWLWLILRKISPAPFTPWNSNTAVQVPNLSELIFSWTIFLAYPSGKVWNIKKTFHSMEWFFSFYIPASERKLGIGWEVRKEGRDSKATQGNVCLKVGGKLLLSRAFQFTVQHSKNHISCVNLSVGFFYRAHVAEMSFPTVLMLCCLTPGAIWGWRSPDPMPALWGSFHRSQRKAGLTPFLFAFYTSLVPLQNIPGRL